MMLTFVWLYQYARDSWAWNPAWADSPSFDPPGVYRRIVKVYFTIDEAAMRLPNGERVDEFEFIRAYMANWDFCRSDEDAQRMMRSHRSISVCLRCRRDIGSNVVASHCGDACEQAGAVEKAIGAMRT